MKNIKKLVAPFLISGIILSVGSNNVYATSNSQNVDAPSINWDEIWNSTDEFPSHTTFGSLESNTLSRSSNDMSTADTVLSATSTKVKSTGITTGPSFVTVGVQTSLGITGMGATVGSYETAFGGTATSTVSMTRGSTVQSWTGRTYHWAKNLALAEFSTWSGQSKSY